METSSFPYVLELLQTPQEINAYLEGIYNTILVKDIIDRKKIADTNDFHDAYRFCNSWNSSQLDPKVYVAEKMQSIICNWKWDIEVSYSNELLKDLVIVPFMYRCKEVFKEALDNNLYIN